MLTERTYYLALKASEDMLKAATKPEHYEIAMKGYYLTQAIIKKWDKEQIDAMRLGPFNTTTDIYRKGKT